MSPIAMQHSNLLSLPTGIHNMATGQNHLVPFANYGAGLKKNFAGASKATKIWIKKVEIYYFRGR